MKKPEKSPLEGIPFPEAPMNALMILIGFALILMIILMILWRLFWS